MKLRSNTQFSQAFKSDNFFSALHGTAGRKKKAPEPQQLRFRGHQKVYFIWQYDKYLLSGFLLSLPSGIDIIHIGHERRRR